MEGFRANAMEALAKHIPADHIRQALDAARKLSDKNAIARVWGPLAQHSDAERAEAVETTRHTSHEYSRAQAFGGLARAAIGDERERTLGDALDAARQITDERARARVLGELAGAAVNEKRQEVLREALEVACQVSGEYQRAEALEALIKHLDATHFGEALDAARHIGQDYSRARALGALVGAAVGDERDRVLGEAPDAARQISSDKLGVNILIALFEHVDAGRFDEALNAARQINAVEARAHALGALAELGRHEEGFRRIVSDYLERPPGDYAELLHCSQVSSPERVDPEAWRKEIRRQARQDKIRVLTRRDGASAFAMLNPSLPDERAGELMQRALARAL